MTVKTYKRLPIEVYGVEWTGKNQKEISEFIGLPKELLFQTGTGILHIPTLEGNMKASTGDVIIKGALGEFYPCKPEAIKNTYEEVPDELSLMMDSLESLRVSYDKKEMKNLLVKFWCKLYDCKFLGWVNESEQYYMKVEGYPGGLSFHEHAASLSDLSILISHKPKQFTLDLVMCGEVSENSPKANYATLVDTTGQYKQIDSDGFAEVNLAIIQAYVKLMMRGYEFKLDKPIR